MPTENQNTAILVLNRDDKDVERITALLEKVGLQVLTSSDPDDTLELLNTAGEPPRLLVIDEAISSTRTPGFLEQVRSVSPGTRILLVSNRDDFEPASGILPSDVRGFLRKPFRRAKFLGSVLSLIDQPLARTA